MTNRKHWYRTNLLPPGFSDPAWSCLAVSFLQHVVVQPLGVLEQPSGWSGPHYSRWTNSTATLAVIRGEPSPVLIFVRPCRPQPPFQTVLAAGRQGSSRPQVSYTWCGAALTTWAGSLGQLNNNIELAAMQRNHNIFYDITSSALHSIIWYYNYNNVLKAYGIKKKEGMRSVAENL